MTFTNRDLYQGVKALNPRWAADQPPLNDYLRSLWQISRSHASAPPTAAQLLDWCIAAFTEPPPAFDPAWLELKWPGWDQENVTFADWERLIFCQIADLQRMTDDGTLSRPDRYYGIDAPSGVRWYNFTPLSYLECGISGTFGGYQTSEVIVLIPSESGSDDSKIYEMPPLTWADLCQMLVCGQQYE